MKRRQYNILAAYWPDDDTTQYMRTFRTLKMARRYARYLISTGKEQVEFWRHVPGGWIPEAVLERSDQ